MGRILTPKPVKLIIGMISGEAKIFEKAQRVLRGKFGTIDSESVFFPFDKTDYYRQEMGDNLQRKFLSFKRLIRPERIPWVKVLTNALEKKLSKGGSLKRAINLDPGYLTSAKLVLATSKNYSHRIYLGKGIFAELALYFKQGVFRSCDWTYPDYRSSEYITFFSGVRKIYLQQIKSYKKRGTRVQSRM